MRAVRFVGGGLEEGGTGARPEGTPGWGRCVRSGTRRSLLKRVSYCGRFDHNRCRFWRAVAGKAPTYDENMACKFVEESLMVLERTPAVLDALLGGLPEEWTAVTEGEGTWSPYVVVGHLIHGEQTDWIPRLEILLKHGTDRAFDPFDREAQFRESAGKPLGALLDAFRELRAESVERLRSLSLTPEMLALRGRHPALGEVTARQLIATWTAHDLGHLVQISRVMAKRYREEVGPWAAYLGVMR